jgi:predicted HicB family RNase H-like nuclease
MTSSTVEDYLETCQRIGKEPNKTYKGSFNVRIPAELHREAAMFAASAAISLNDFVKTAIQYALINRGTASAGKGVKARNKENRGKK